MELQEEKNFVLRCEKDLPKMLMVDGVNYKLYAHGLLSGGFRISYGEFDGNFFNWENKPIDLFYNIVEMLPSTKEYKEGELQDVSIYKTNIDDVISDCLDKMKTWHNGLYTELNEITSRETQNSDKSQKPKLGISDVIHSNMVDGQLDAVGALTQIFDEECAKAVIKGIENNLQIMKTIKKFIIKAEVVIMAKDEKQARELWEQQLTYSRYGEHPLDSSNVEAYDEQTKLKQVVELKHNGKKWVKA